MWNELKLLGAEFLSQTMLFADEREYWRRISQETKAKKEFTRIQRSKQKGSFRYQVYVRDKGICWLCGKFVYWKDYEIEHKIPVSKWGESSDSNCFVSHRWCNRSKGSKII